MNRWESGPIKILLVNIGNEEIISWSIITQCVHQYIGVLNTLSEEHNQEKMYSDYRKAFNKLNHKLSKLETQGNVLSWFISGV